MMKNQHYYLELKDGQKVVKRLKTSIGSEYEDRSRLETFYQKPGQKIQFVVSSSKEKIIN